MKLSSNLRQKRDLTLMISESSLLHTNLNNRLMSRLSNNKIITISQSRIIIIKTNWQSILKLMRSSRLPTIMWDNTSSSFNRISNNNNRTIISCNSNKMYRYHIIIIKKIQSNLKVNSIINYRAIILTNTRLVLLSTIDNNRRLSFLQRKCFSTPRYSVKELLELYIVQNIIRWQRVNQFASIRSGTRSNQEVSPLDQIKLASSRKLITTTQGYSLVICVSVVVI